MAESFLWQSGKATRVKKSKQIDDDHTLVTSPLPARRIASVRLFCIKCKERFICYDICNAEPPPQPNPFRFPVSRIAVILAWRYGSPAASQTNVCLPLQRLRIASSCGGAHRQPLLLHRPRWLSLYSSGPSFALTNLNHFGNSRIPNWLPCCYSLR